MKINLVDISVIERSGIDGICQIKIQDIMCITSCLSPESDKNLFLIHLANSIYYKINAKTLNKLEAFKGMVNGFTIVKLKGYSKTMEEYPTWINIDNISVISDEKHYIKGACETIKLIRLKSGTVLKCSIDEFCAIDINIDTSILDDKHDIVNIPAYL